MGCGTCGTGKPGGCKSNGGCSTGSCNRMNVHDWLMNLPFSDPESTCKVIEVSFKQGSRKDFFRNPTLQYFEKGEYITVEGVSGFDVGEVSMVGEMVRLQLKKKGIDEFDPEIKRVLRRSSERDIESFKQNKAREQDALMRSRAIARTLNLRMKLSEIEFQADGKKATFFYTADDRVDFRELIKSFAGDFKIKVEMRQIGIRQEAGKIGGIGSCGRELCCSTWLTDFKSVITTAARYQNLSINQTKLSGQCGRLKCCLNYELDTYLDALQHFPDNAETIQTTKGNANLIKKDIFKNLMWYMLPDSSKQYPLTIQRVKDIQRLNSRGEKPDDLQPVELTSSKVKEVEPTYVDLVGQISLRSLERNDKKGKIEKETSLLHNKILEIGHRKIDNNVLLKMVLRIKETGIRETIIREISVHGRRIQEIKRQVRASVHSKGEIRVINHVAHSPIKGHRSNDPLKIPLLNLLLKTKNKSFQFIILLVPLAISRIFLVKVFL